MRKIKNKKFTLMEILCVMAIIMVLLTLLMPSYQNSKERAKYVRWLSYNSMIDNDKDCLVNYNFEEGTGDTLTVRNVGCEKEKFNAKLVNGKIKGEYSWASGRFSQCKKAVQFNGGNTYIEVPGTNLTDLNNSGGFTFLTWVKFDNCVAPNVIVSKKNRNIVGENTQYQLYYSGTSENDEFTINVFNSELSCNVNDVTNQWVYLAFTFEKTGESASYIPSHDINSLAYCVDDEDEDEDEDVDEEDEDVDEEEEEEWDDDDDDDDDYSEVIRQGRICLYYNGEKIGEKNISYGNIDCSNNKMIIGADWNNESEGSIRSNFFGKMDEFIVFERCLSPYEIKGHYEMGKK